MFRIQNWKQALGLMALGSVFTVIGMILSPVTAQRDKFGEIECTKLTIVDSDGNSMAYLWAGEYGGRLDVFSKKDTSNRAAVFVGKEDGGARYLRGNKANNASSVLIYIGENGGDISIDDKSDNEVIRLHVDELGGRLDIDNIGKVACSQFKVIGPDNKTRIILEADESQGGEIKIVGGDGNTTAKLHSTDYGGRLDIFGKNDNTTKAFVGVNEYGNGVVNTWDKRGYRLHMLGDK